jgi:hypothetical protein
MDTRDLIALLGRQRELLFELEQQRSSRDNDTILDLLLDVDRAIEAARQALRAA